ncbi:hemolysin transporter protein shlB, partial [Yersinia pestis PY-47]
MACTQYWRSSRDAFGHRD